MRLPFERLSPVRLRWFDSFCNRLDPAKVQAVLDMARASVVVSCGPDVHRVGRDDPGRRDRWWRLRTGVKDGWTDAVLACPELLPDEVAALGFRRTKSFDTAVSCRWDKTVLRGAMFCLGCSKGDDGAALPFTVRRLAGGIELLRAGRDPYGVTPEDKSGVMMVRVMFARTPPAEVVVGGNSHLVPREWYGYATQADPDDYGLVMIPPEMHGD